MNEVKQVWDIEPLGEVRRSYQDRFEINLYQLDILESTHIEEEFEKNWDIGGQLIDVLGAHLSIRDLQSVVDVFYTELVRRLDQHATLSNRK
ncbi:hypothetical protein D3C78_1228640 [compost metagenome]